MTRANNMLVGAVLGLLILCVMSTAQARPFHHSFGELREYHRHWLAVCPDVHEPDSASDYRNSCWASTFTGTKEGSFAGSFPGNRLSVHRNRKTGAHKITFVGTFVEKIDRSRRVRVKFSDGSVLKYTYGSGVTPNQNSGNEYTFRVKADVKDLMRRMRAGNHMTIILPTKSGEEKMFFSLQGLGASMNFAEKYTDR